MTFLAIDIGNTRLKWALYARAADGEQPLAHGAEFLENIDKLADGIVYAHFGKSSIARLRIRGAFRAGGLGGL